MKKHPHDSQENPQQLLVLYNLVQTHMKSYKYQLQRLLSFFFKHIFICVVENKYTLGIALLPLILKGLSLESLS